MGRSFLPADLSARFEQWLFNRRIPRSQETVRMLLGQIRQPISVYGAGSHTLQLMQWGLKVNRVFDRLGSSVSGFPLPVQPLNQWRPKDGPLLLSHAEHEWTMRDHLASCGIPCIPLYTREDFETPMEPVDAPAKGDKPRVVVLTAQSRALLNSEHFSALAPEFEIIPLHAGTRFQTNPGLPILGSHLLAYAWVEQLQPDLLILQDHFSDGHFWPLWAQLFFPNVPTVLALYDVLRFTFDDPYILAHQGFWSEEDVRLALFCEQNAITSGFIVKDGCGNQLPAPSHHFLPGHSRTTFLQPQGCEEAARLVYAGHIASEQTDPRLYGDNQLLPIFQSLIHQGFKLDAYLTSPQNLFDLHYPNYLRLQANANFHLLPTLPVQTLLQNINRAFAGLQWGSPPANSLQTVSHPVTVSKKILTYAAAGIPVVLGSYLSGMAEWVREYQMGWSVGELQETDLQQLFSRQTRESRIPGLMAFREMSCLESQIKGLIPFLRKYIQA